MVAHANEFKSFARELEEHRNVRGPAEVKN